MIIYLCMKYESNTPMSSKDIAWKPFFVRTGRTYVRTDGRTDKGDTICPPIINGGSIKTGVCDHFRGPFTGFIQASMRKIQGIFKDF